MNLEQHHQDIQRRLEFYQRREAVLARELEQVRASINAALGALRFCEKLMEQQREEPGND